MEGYKLKKEVIGAVVVPILNENNQETDRILLDADTSEEDLQKVFALEACKHYFESPQPLKGGEDVQANESGSIVEPDADASKKKE